MTPLAVTMGDPAGIGGELTLQAWKTRRNDRPFFVIDHPARLASLARRLGWDVPVAPVSSVGDVAGLHPQALAVFPLPERPDRQTTENDARDTLLSIEWAVRFVQSGQASALVTNPITKSTLYEVGFAYPGHTEYLGALAQSAQPPVMMLVSPQLRVVPVTVHLSLRDALKQLDCALLRQTILTTHNALQTDFGIAFPRIAVAGLNPHAGENGTMGGEENDIIAPVLADCIRDGLTLSGPLPADSLFHARAREGYDVALCMYHDQALIPLKTLDFDRGVNATLGLPFIRTSPDHGTARDIAGQGRANPSSFLAALDTAWIMAHNRQMSTSQNPDPVFAHGIRRRLVRQTAFCDPQIPEYSAPALENSFPASQQRREVLRGAQVPKKTTKT